MVFSGYDFNEVDRHRRDHVEEKLGEGSPVVGVSCADGILLLTLRGTQRKVYEIYDRLIYSAIGNQSDIESIRVGTIDAAHREGFERSPDDVTAQRLVGFFLSPALKRIFGELTSAPAIIRALFGELGHRSEDDQFFVLNYDGEFTLSHGFAAIGGSADSEARMAHWLSGITPKTTREQALELALKAWAAGAMQSSRRQVKSDPDEELNPLRDIDEADEITSFLREQLKERQIEVGVLDRHTHRESRFRLLTEKELEPVLREYR